MERNLERTVKPIRIEIPLKEDIWNKRVSISSRFHGVNLGCGTEQRRERIATEPRQSRNPRRDRKIRIVGSSRLVKHSAHASRGRGPIPARSSVKIARSITNQLDEDEGRREKREGRKAGREKERADARDPKEQGRWISLVSSPAFRIPDRKLTRINACPLCRWQVVYGMANGCCWRRFYTSPEDSFDCFFGVNRGDCLFWSRVAEVWL